MLSMSKIHTYDFWVHHGTLEFSDNSRSPNPRTIATSKQINFKKLGTVEEDDGRLGFIGFLQSVDDQVNLVFKIKFDLENIVFVG